MEKEGLVQVSSNKFEVLRDRVMQKEERSGSRVRKNRRDILREERAKREIEV